MKKILCAMMALLVASTVAIESHAAVVSELILLERTPFVVGTPTVIDIVLKETRDIGDTSSIGTLTMVSGNIRFGWSALNTFSISDLNDHETQGGRFFDNGADPADPSIKSLDFTTSFGTVEQNDLLVSLTSDPLGTIDSSTQATLRLASFTLSGGAVGESITFTMSDFDALLDDIVLEDGSILDGQITFGSLTITGTSGGGGGGGVVPEPTSMALFGSLLSGLLVRLRKRSTQQ